MIIWVASYPKSGNTWVRSIISSLVYTEDGIFDFPIIKKIDQYPQRRFLEYFTQDYNNIHEIKKHWITSQERINLDTKIKFFKTHHLNCKIDNYPFTNKECTRATIYIVRDPRNLIDSISNHFSKSIEESKKFLLTSKILSPGKEIELRGGNVITYLGSWKEHYKFWTNDNENLLIIEIGCGINPHSLRLKNGKMLSGEWKLPKINNLKHSIRINPENDNNIDKNTIHIKMGAKKGLKQLF